MIAGQSEIINLEVVRGKIKINPVTFQIRENIGYIKLDGFNSNTEEFITNTLEEMDKQNIDKIILDLRNNPGGEVAQAVAVH